MNRYIIMSKNGEAYKRSYTNDLSLPSDFVVEGTKDYYSARVFHFLRWATHKARQLTRKSKSAYYVYLQVAVDGKNYYNLVDKHINDDIFEKDDKYQAEIESVISEWKEKKHLS